MSIFHRSLLDVDSLTNQDVELLFKRASQFKKNGFPEIRPGTHRPVVALLFFEPSTRTRFSFETASARLGMNAVVMDNMASTSIRKGETLADTVLNVAAMGVDALVIRFDQNAELQATLPALKMSVISAGQGWLSHPTQALLDAFTIREELGQIEGQRVLIVGDVAHSRVAASNIKLLTRLGAQVGVTGPREFVNLPHELSAQVRHFENFDEGIAWASVIMALRIQLERLKADVKNHFKPQQYVDEYGINPQRLERFKAEGIILHPGPVNQNVELDAKVLFDPRCRILRQVENGVMIRSALLYEMLLADQVGLND